MKKYLLSKAAFVKSNRSRLASFLIVSAGLVVSGTASAVDSAAQTAINTAISDGQALLGTVAPGVIGIAAIMMGVGLVIRWISK